MNWPKMDDATDGRERGEWQSKYTDPVARRWIRIESAYLAILLITAPSAMLVLWLGYPQHWLQLSDPKYQTLLLWGLAWIAGTFGGTLFDIKWLYRSVARQFWHMDRRPWRFFTPHISGGLAFIVIALISSGLVRVFDRLAFQSLSLVVGVAFLAGYFADSTLAKLSEIADTLFGRSTGKKEASDKKDASPGVSK